VAFRGTFEYTLDAKNRLTVPAKFRPVLSGGVVLAQDFEPCVGLWPPEAYDRYTAGMLADRSPGDQEWRELRRYFSANAHDTELDGAGRVMLPPFLMEHAGLKREVVVAGTGDHMEIWDRSAWASYNGELRDRVVGITAA
jgi:MraZ protein